MLNPRLNWMFSKFLIYSQFPAGLPAQSFPACHHQSQGMVFWKGVLVVDFSPSSLCFHPFSLARKRHNWTRKHICYCMTSCACGCGYIPSFNPAFLERLWIDMETCSWKGFLSAHGRWKLAPAKPINEIVMCWLAPKCVERPWFWLAPKIKPWLSWVFQKPRHNSQLGFGWRQKSNHDYHGFSRNPVTIPNLDLAGAKNQTMIIMGFPENPS